MNEQIDAFMCSNGMTIRGLVEKQRALPEQTILRERDVIIPI